VKNSKQARPAPGDTARWIAEVYDYHLAQLPRGHAPSDRRILEMAKTNASFHKDSSAIYQIAEDVALGLLDLPEVERRRLDASLRETFGFSCIVFLRKSLKLADDILKGKKILKASQYYAVKELVYSGALEQEVCRACELELTSFEERQRMTGPSLG